MGRLCFVACVAAVLLAGCSGGKDAATTQPPATPRELQLPALPPEVLAVQRGDRVALVGTDGKAIAGLDGFRVARGDLGSPGRLERGPEWFELSRSGRRLVAVPQRASARAAAYSDLPAWCPHPEVVGERGTTEWYSCVDRNGRGVLADDLLRKLVPAPRGALVGHWSLALPSPDGTRLLLQWSGECESPSAYLAPARGGAPSGVTADPATESIAVGWTHGGRPLVLLPKGLCGAGSKVPGVYAVDPGGLTLVARGSDAVLLRL